MRENNDSASSSKERDQHTGILKDSNQVKVGDDVAKKIIVPSHADLLYQDAMERVVRHKRIQRAFMEKECTFSPQVNRSDHSSTLNSSSIANTMKKKASKQVGNRLYKQAVH